VTLSTRARSQGLIAFAVTTLVWGSTWLAIKDQLGKVPPEWSVTWRFAIAAAGMFLLAAVRGERLRVGQGAAVLAAAVGFFQFFVNFQLVYQAERYLTSGLVAVLFALLVVPNAVLGWIFIGRRVGARFLLGSVVAIGGIALLVIHEYRASASGQSVLNGLGLTALAILSASSANVLQAGQSARRTPVVVLLAWAMLAGTLANAAWAWGTVGGPVFDSSLRYVLGLFYLGLIGSVLTFPLYAILLRDWGPGRAAYNAVLIPVVAMVLSTLFEGYHWSALAVGGAALSIAGLLIALSGRD